MLSSDTTLAEALRQVAEAHPNREALVCGGTRLTYGQLWDRVRRAASGLEALGVGKGERVALGLVPGIEFAIAFFAASGLGAVVVPLNPQMRPAGLQEMLRDAEVKAALLERAPEGIEAHLPAVRVVAVERSEGSTGLAELLAHPPRLLPHPEVSPDDLAALLYTSGTTGRPKGAMHSHRSLLAPVAASVKLRELWLRRLNLGRALDMARAITRYGARLLRAAGRPQTFLSTTGWHTITGLEVLLQALLMGDRLVVLPRFHPREALRLVQEEQVTILVAVPLAYQVMLGILEQEALDTSSLLICATGAAPCPPHLARAIRRRFGCAVHIGFGATETAGGIAATSIADSDEQQAETVGRPMPGVEVRIVDEARRPLPPGQIGELACRSEGVMLGYHRAPERTAEVLDGEGWYYTGDLAWMDERGYLHIVGRKKDVIIRGGQNIYPEEIESYLTAHPKVRQAAVVGIPGALGEESVWAFIRLEEGAEMTVQEVLDYCRAGLEPFQIPSQVRFLPELPQGEPGKSQKFKLREMALAEPSEG
ncbi:MAG: class I adenylate-forming enzyme family protein [Chloroflexia bacterium]